MTSATGKPPRIGLTATNNTTVMNDEILFPVEPEKVDRPAGKRVLVEATDQSGKSKLLRGGVSAEAGYNARVSGTTLGYFGEEGVEVSYTGVGARWIFCHDGWLIFDAVFAVLAASAAIADAVLTLSENYGKNADSFAHRSALSLFVLACVVVIGGLIRKTFNSM